MGASSRRFAWLGAIAFATAGGVFAACGLDESGTLTVDASIQDAPVIDQNVIDTYVETAPPPPPLSCEEAGMSLDASCLGFPIPDGGWQPIGFQSGNVGCGAGTYEVQAVLGNVQLANGACGCTGCNVTGSWSCNATLGEGTGCTTTTSVNANTCTTASHMSFGETLVRSGTAACSGGQEYGDASTTSTGLTMCFPQSCTDDYCGLAKLGFKLCIYNPNVTNGACPANFQVSSQIVGQAPVGLCNTCNTCMLSNADAGCTGTVYAYDDAGCTGNILDASSVSDACVDLPTNYQSLFFEAGPVPTPTCASTTNVTDGSVALNAPWTICCSN